MIPISKPSITQLEIDYVTDAVKSTWVSSLGKYIDQFEVDFAKFCHTKYGVALMNGTVAIQLALESCGVKEGHEVIVPDLSFIATANAILNIGAVPVFADIDPVTFCLDPNKIEELITSNTKAILPVHLYGHPANMPAIMAIAKKHNLMVIEDAAEAHGSTIDGTPVGAWGDCATFSFYGNKNITTGEGGMITTNSLEIYEKSKFLRDHAMSKSKRYWHPEKGYNYRMTNVEAAFLYDQLNDVDNILKNKRKIFDNYTKLFKGLIQAEKIKLFVKDHNTDNADWIFAIRLVGNTKTIDETTAFFRDAGIDIRPFFYPINKHGHLASIENNDSVSEILNQEIIMIPSSPSITIEEQQKVVDVISQFLFSKEHIKIIRIDDSNVDILGQFITKIDDKHFRYFDKRTSDCIVNHLVTFLFYDINQDEYFGYTHIDYDNESKKNWFGIYLDKLYRGKKLGNLLLNYTIYSCNLDIIYLSVDVDNENAIKLYIKNGFSIEQTKNNIHYCTKYIQNGV